MWISITNCRCDPRIDTTKPGHLRFEDSRFAEDLINSNWDWVSKEAEQADKEKHKHSEGGGE